MREAELRRVLLVKAIEESDREGALIPVADRIAAGREAKRNAVETGVKEEALLATRATILLAKIAARYPFVETVLALVGGPAWIGWLLIAVALLFGIALSALDGTRRINILAFPLLGLVLWNLAVYAVVALDAMRPAPVPGSGRRWLPALLAHSGVVRATRLVGKSRSFNTPLSEALGRFTSQWYVAAKPLLVRRATRLFHLCAAAVGIGLIAGLYLRGIALDYRAGWESTFLDARQVRAVLSFLYGPASLVTGIPIPDAAHLEAIRWLDGAGGEGARQWIHLLAASAAVFIVAPRLLLALLATFAIARLSLRAPLPPELATYFRKAFGAAGAIDRGIVTVMPYAYEPDANAFARLRTLLPAELGEHLAVDLQAPVRYGDEEAFLANLRARDGGLAEVVVLLMSLAATPEEENHGTVIAGVRDWLAAARPGTQLLVLVDEGPYAGRMGAQGGPQTRVAERRKAWQEFIAARGLKAWLADLSL